MLMPPDAEPVIPASTLTAIEAEISGCSGATLTTADLIRANPASDAMVTP